MLPSWVDEAVDAVSDEPGRRHAIAIGGRGQTSNWVVFVGGRASLFLKTAPIDEAGDLHEEHRALAAAAEGFGTGVPAPLGLHQVRGRLVLAQSIQPGRSLAMLLRSRRRNGPRTGAADLRAVTEWAAQLAASDAVADDGTAPEVPGHALRSRAAELATHPTFARLVAVLDEEPAERPVPVHGDLWPGNVIVGKRGGLGVVDWQHAHRGRSLHDIFFFLFTYAHSHPAGKWQWRTAEEAFAAAFLDNAWLPRTGAEAVRRELRRRGASPGSAEARLLLFLLDLGAHEGPRVGPPADWRALARVVLDQAGRTSLA